ncbi:MAG: gliding motility protein GldM [Cyclobacteriaceae bacterium]
MAGGKETPRQKMISLMYLVLIAMMALQVSGAILDKFYFLDQSLRHAVDAEYEQSAVIINSMESEVEKRGSKANEVKALESAKEVRQKALNLNAKIEEIREALVKKSGGRDENKKPKGMKDEESVANLLVGPGESKSGEGYKLKKLIEVYVADINATLKSLGRKPLESLTKSAKDDPLFAKDDHQTGKDWVELNFTSTPVIAAMATLSERESKIVQYEHEVLNALANQVGVKDYKFDKLVGMYRLKSSVVAAGTDIEGEIFVTAFSSSLKPEITINGRSTVIDPSSGMGKFKNKVSATKYDKDGFSKQSYKAAIKLQDTTMVFPVEYTVSKPVIQVQSASVQALYRNCGNELVINVPALGSYYNPTFSLGAGEGVVKANPKKKGEIVIIPSKKSINLTVKSDGNRIGTEKFGVRLVPKPEIQIKIAGQTANTKQGVSSTKVGKGVKLLAVADKGFSDFLPKDAKYTVREADIILVRGKKPVGRVSYPASTRSLAARPGDRLLIEIKSVVRRTYTGGSEKVKLSATSALINVPII